MTYKVNCSLLFFFVVIIPLDVEHVTSAFSTVLSKTCPCSEIEKSIAVEKKKSSDFGVF